MSYFQKSESTLNIAKGITDPKGLNAFTTVTAVKRRVTLPKQIIINPKIHVPDFRPLNRALFGCFPKKMQHDFPITRGGGGFKDRWELFRHITSWLKFMFRIQTKLRPQILDQKSASISRPNRSMGHTNIALALKIIIICQSYQ